MTLCHNINSRIKIRLNLFVQFLGGGQCNSSRYYHSSVLIDNKLYFSGGLLNYSLFGVTNEFFYLDVSKPFTTTDNASIPWVDLTYTDGPLQLYAKTCIGGKNNDMIFIIGGTSTPGVNKTFVNQFDTNKQQWIDFTSIPTNREQISCANLDNGLIAIFSGSFTATYGINDLWIFNTLTLTWSLSNATNTPRYGNCAVTLPDGNILYIGGVNYNATMNNLPLYNTKSDTWTNVSISGPNPPVREFFSAVLTSDGRIIIFGGYNGANLGDLWILDITMFQWSIGKILNPIVNLTLSGHTATLVDNYMFVAFGKFSIVNFSSTIFMLDVSRKDSYKWVTEFTPNTTTTTNNTTTTSTTSSDSKNTSIIIGTIIGSIISLIMFVIASILTLKFIDKNM
ncbi:19438_t:CDS:2 [Gigaspora margarita]|uniref:19438_t:CDS:1 n=1 Tax=Gigaspora margarita TaxID=4874 RepID=A0ABN7V3G9_GIGMA|nr:19438_t:CDS:2 [Gigaspora margarita]